MILFIAIKFFIPLGFMLLEVLNSPNIGEGKVIVVGLTSGFATLTPTFERTHAFLTLQLK